MASNRPRLRDVAARAGVSTTTVVRVMRDPTKVAQPTRERVEAILTETAYTPDLLARGLALNRTDVVAAIVPLLTNSLVAEVVHGLSTTLEAAGIHLLLGPSGFSAAREEALVRAFLSRRVDALFLTGTTHTAATRAMLTAARIPVIEGGNLPSSPIDMAVGFSNHEAALVATRHLIARGYDPIGYLGAPSADNDRAADRRRGFHDAMRAGGRKVDPALVMETDLDMASGAQAMNALLDTRAGLRALLCSADALAAGALFACQKRGVRVPDQVALAGFDDIEIARLVTPALTTIRVPRLDIGRFAGELMLARFAGGASQKRVIDTGFELVVREST